MHKSRGGEDYINYDEYHFINKYLWTKAGPQPTDIFGGTKRCNLLLHLTSTYVCENFGGEIPPLLPSGCGPGPRCHHSGPTTLGQGRKRVEISVLGYLWGKRCDIIRQLSRHQVIL